MCTRNKIQGALVTTIAVFAAGCGASGPTSLSGFPKITDPVSASSTGVELQQSGTAKAATGVKIATFAEAFGTPSSGMVTATSAQSRAFCEAGQAVKSIFQSALQPDMMMCFMSSMEKEKFISSSIYDGASHVITFSNMPQSLGGSGGTPKIKINVTRNGSAISAFNSFICSSSSQTSNDNFFGATASGSNVTLTSVYVGSGYGGRNVASGAISSSGAWTSKTITDQSTYSSGTYSDSEYNSLVQNSSTITLSTYRTGTYGSSNTYTNKEYAVMQVLNGGSLSTLALGDGAAKVVDVFAGSNFATTSSWNGDSLAVMPSGNDYTAQVTSASVPTPQTVSVSLAASETWDCSTSGTPVNIDMSSTAGAALVTDLQNCVTTLTSAITSQNYTDCHNGS
ncbi:MAG: hypothetical protein ACXWPM_01710 [Bdellovibrionota bacterium]